MNRNSLFLYSLQIFCLQLSLTSSLCTFSLTSLNFSLNFIYQFLIQLFSPFCTQLSIPVFLSSFTFFFFSQLFTLLLHYTFSLHFAFYLLFQIPTSTIYFSIYFSQIFCTTSPLNFFTPLLFTYSLNTLSTKEKKQRNGERNDEMERESE